MIIGLWFVLVLSYSLIAHFVILFLDGLKEEYGTHNSQQIIARKLYQHMLTKSSISALNKIRKQYYELLLTDVRD